MAGLEFRLSWAHEIGRKKVLRGAIAAIELKVGERLFIQAKGLKFAPNGDERAEAIVYMLQDGVPLTVAPEAFRGGKGRLRQSGNRGGGRVARATL